MAIFMRSNISITNPLPDTPSIPDIASDLYFDFNAADLVSQYAQGADVTEWVGSGPAPLLNRTLNYKGGSSFKWPTLDLTGGPNATPTVKYGIDFRRLRTTDANVVEYRGPLTWVVVGKIIAPPPTNTARMIGTSYVSPITEKAGVNIMPSQNDNIWAVAAGADAVITPNTHTDFAIAVSHSPDRIMTHLSTVPDVFTVERDADNPGYNGFGTGFSFSGTASGESLNGTMTRIMMFTRAFNESSLRAMIDEMRTQYNF